MATLDELDQRLNQLESRVQDNEQDISDLEGNVHNNQASIQSLQSGLQQTNANVTDLSNKHNTDVQEIKTKHDADIAATNGRVTVLETWRTNTVDPTLQDHEKRIVKIEYSHIIYTTTRTVKSPMRVGDGIQIYIPTDLVLEDFMAINQGVGSQTYHWFTKIFNPNGAGKVSFDLDRRDNGHIKTVTIGQNARVLIPTGLRIKLTPAKSSLKIANIKELAIYKGLQFTIETLDGDPSKELIIGVSNPTTQVIDLPAGGPLVQLLHYFTYKSTPQLLTQQEFDALDEEGFVEIEEP